MGRIHDALQLLAQRGYFAMESNEPIVHVVPLPVGQDERPPTDLTAVHGKGDLDPEQSDVVSLAHANTKIDQTSSDPFNVEVVTPSLEFNRTDDLEPPYKPVVVDSGVPDQHQWLQFHGAGPPNVEIPTDLESIEQGFDEILSIANIEQIQEGLDSILEDELPAVESTDSQTEDTVESPQPPTLDADVSQVEDDVHIDMSGPTEMIQLDVASDPPAAVDEPNDVVVDSQESAPTETNTLEVESGPPATVHDAEDIQIDTLDGVDFDDNIVDSTRHVEETRFSDASSAVKSHPQAGVMDRVEQVLGTSPDSVSSTIDSGTPTHQFDSGQTVADKATGPSERIVLANTGAALQQQIAQNQASENIAPTEVFESSASSDSPYTPVLDTWADLPEPTPATQESPRDHQDELVPTVEVLSRLIDSPRPPAFVFEDNEQVEQPKEEIQDRPSVKPTEYEARMAKNLLETSYGQRIKQLSDEFNSHVPGEGPHIALLVSVEKDSQRADAAAALAMLVCGQRERNTLLVDADIDQQHVSVGFEKHNTGLIEAISGQVPWSESVQSTSCEKLQLLPCGKDIGFISPDSEQEEFQRISHIAAQWREEYGLIVIDGGLVDSPLLPTLTRTVDATIVCVQLGTSQREELTTAVKRLQEAGGNVVGCITTAPPSVK